MIYPRSGKSPHSYQHTHLSWTWEFPDVLVCNLALQYFAGLSPVCPCLSYTEEPSTGQGTQMCLTRTELRSRTTSLDLLTMLCLMHPRRVLAFFK